MTRTLSWRARRAWTKRFGTLRDQERTGILKRPHYAYGLLRAADLAAAFGLKGVTAIEFGVAEGGGLLNMAALARRIGAATGVELKVVGFDTGSGLPPPDPGPKDHPELWSPGDFAMPDPDALRRRIAGEAELVLGQVRDTVRPFVDALADTHPVGFVALDVDLYSASRDALAFLDAAPAKLLPAIAMYLDDVASIFSNRWCGELAAVEEFNAAHETRKIDRDRTGLDCRPDSPQPWQAKMHVAHVLDHPARLSPADRAALSIGAHQTLMATRNIG